MSRNVTRSLAAVVGLSLAWGCAAVPREAADAPPPAASPAAAAPQATPPPAAPPPARSEATRPQAPSGPAPAQSTPGEPNDKPKEQVGYAFTFKDTEVALGPGQPKKKLRCPDGVALLPKTRKCGGKHVEECVLVNRDTEELKFRAQTPAEAPEFAVVFRDLKTLLMAKEEENAEKKTDKKHYKLIIPTGVVLGVEHGFTIHVPGCPVPDPIIIVDN
jgi:hypothetical protein